MSHQSKRPRKYIANGNVNWAEEKNIKLLKQMISRGYSVESIANRMFTTQSSIRNAIERYTVGLRRLRRSKKAR